MKPNINFLRKVAAGQVRLSFGYSPASGGRYTFRGGEATYERHLKAGYVHPIGAASFGRPAIARLTEAIHLTWRSYFSPTIREASMNFQHKKREIAKETAREIANIYVRSYTTVAERDSVVSKAIQEALDTMWKYLNSAEREKGRLTWRTPPPSTSRAPSRCFG